MKTKIWLKAVLVWFVCTKIKNDRRALSVLDYFFGEHVEDEFHQGHSIDMDACRYLNQKAVMRYWRLLQYRKDRAHLYELNQRWFFCTYS